MPRAQVTAENSQRIFSTAPHHAPCHVSRGLARGRSAAKIALGGSGHHRGVCQLADFVSALPCYTVGPGKTVNLFHTVIHGSSHPRDPTGRSESSRPRCTPQCSSLGCGARRMLNARILEAIEQHVEWLTRRCAHRSHPGVRTYRAAGDAPSREVEVVNQIADFTCVNLQLVGFGRQRSGQDLHLHALVGFPSCVETCGEVAGSGSD